MVAKGRKEAMVKSKNNKVDNFVIYSNSTYKIANQYFSVLLKFKIYVYLSISSPVAYFTVRGSQPKRFKKVFCSKLAC